MKNSSVQYYDIFYLQLFATYIVIFCPCINIVASTFLVVLVSDMLLNIQFFKLSLPEIRLKRKNFATSVHFIKIQLFHCHSLGLP